MKISKHRLVKTIKRGTVARLFLTLALLVALFLAGINANHRTVGGVQEELKYHELV